MYLSGAEKLQADMERAIKDHQEEFGQVIAKASAGQGPIFPTVGIASIREAIKIAPKASVRAESHTRSYIARQQLATGGRCASEAQLETARDQAEECASEGAQKDVETVPIQQPDPTPRALRPPCN